MEELTDDRKDAFYEWLSEARPWKSFVDPDGNWWMPMDGRVAYIGYRSKLKIEEELDMETDEEWPWWAFFELAMENMMENGSEKVIKFQEHFDKLVQEYFDEQKR